MKVVCATYVREWKCTFESWSCCTLHEWMKIHFWKLKLSPFMCMHLHMIFSKFTFESWSWCPLWINENECINMHVSNRQKPLCITCDVWNETCLARENALLYCLCLQRSHKYHVSCLPIPWALTLCIFRFLLCWYFVSQMLHLYSLSWNKNTHFFKILFPTFYMFFFFHFFKGYIF